MFTRTGIKGSLTLRCVTSQQRSHGSFHAIKICWRSSKRFPELCALPSPPVPFAVWPQSLRSDSCPSLKTQPSHQPGNFPVCLGLQPFLLLVLLLSLACPSEGALCLAGRWKAKNKHLPCGTNKRNVPRSPGRTAQQLAFGGIINSPHVVMFSSLATQAEQEHPQWGGRAGLGLPRAQQHPGSGSELNQPLLPHPQPPCWDEALWDTSVHQPRLSSHSIYWLHCLKQFPFSFPFPGESPCVSCLFTL